MTRFSIAVLAAVLASCSPSEPDAPPAPAAPARQFTQAEHEACLTYYANYAARRRNRYCNPAHDLGYFVDGMRQDTGGRIADGGPAT